MNASIPAEHGRPWISPSEALGRRPPVSASARVDAPEAERAARYGFLAGPLGLLIARGATGEILDDASIFSVPNTAGWLLGMVNQRGNLVPVFDLGALVDVPADAARRLLVVGAGADAVAFPVERLPGAVRIGEPLDPRPPVPAPFEAHTRASYLVDNQLWLEIDLDGLLTGLAVDLSR